MTLCHRNTHPLPVRFFNKKQKQKQARSHLIRAPIDCLPRRSGSSNILSNSNIRQTFLFVDCCQWTTDTSWPTLKED